MTTPSALVRALEEEVARIPVPLGKQVRALSELFGLFTGERSGLHGSFYLDTPKLRTAYLRYHLPLNVARASWVLADVLRVYPRLSELRDVADLGAGLGSASLASLHGLPPEVERSFWLFDKSRSALKMARVLLERSAAPGSARITTKALRLPSLPLFPRPTLVWLAMVLNEIEAGARGESPSKALLDRLAERLKPGSVLLVIEPALRGPGRSLLEAHEGVLASGAWRVLAPCTHQLSCPLLRLRDRPWCHFKFRWDVPGVVREIADPLGLDPLEPGLAYLALERISPGEKLSPGEPLARVIGDPMRLERGGFGVYVCENGRRETIEARGPITRGDRVSTRGLTLPRRDDSRK